MYNKKIIEYFQHPKNFGKMKKSSGKGEYESPVCGDITTFYIKVKNDKIIDVKFITFGCAVSISAAVALSEMVKGMTVKEASEITPQKIAKELGELPSAKLHCSVLAYNAFKQAIKDYRKNKKK